MAKQVFRCIAILCLTWSLTQATWAQLTNFDWTGSVSTDWQQDGNWDMTDFPNAGNQSASVTTSSSLAVDLGVNDTIVAALSLNATNPATALHISSSGGGRLILQNDDDNTFFDDVNPEIAPVLVHAGVNDGRVLIDSRGDSNSTNEISAPVRVNNGGFLEGVDFVGDRSITLSGDMDITGDDMVNPYATFAQLRSFLPADQKVVISGNISLMDPIIVGSPARSLGLNNYGTTDHGVVDDVPMPNDDRSPPRGTIEITGVISGTGGLSAGWEWAPAGEQVGNDPAPPPTLPLGTVILSGNNTFTGNVAISRGNLVVRHDNALGDGGLFTQSGESGNTKEVGYNLIADTSDITISNPMSIVQWQTFKGDFSVTWDGMIYQNSARGLINLLEHDLANNTGATLTVTGPVYACREAEDPPEPGRIISFDGTGRTVVTGGIHDMLEDDPLTELVRVGSLRKRGTGTLVIDFDESNTTDSATDYQGYTYVESGNLHFASDNDLPNPGSIGLDTTEVLSSGGAVGFDEGVHGVNASHFLNQLNNSSNPNWTPATTPPFFRTIPLATVVFNRYDHGGLMLAADEYDDDLNFNNGALARAANMTLAAWETGSTFTGTLTPSSSVQVNPNTYQLGGGSGTLTLPNDNQLTGARNLLVANGGEVRLTGVNSYSGSTKIMGKFHTSLQEDAAADTADPQFNDDYTDNPQRIYLGTTLTVTNLTDGGSSIGTSTAASALHIQGSTLRYEGSAVTTNRLLTVGTAGATIDASGSGPLQFNNPGALVIDVAENRSGAVAGAIAGSDNNEIFGIPSFSSGGIPLTFDTSDLVPGMAVRDLGSNDLTADDDDEILITSIVDPHAIRVAEANVDPSEVPFAFPTGTFITTFDFGPAPARTLILTGNNTDDNILASSIGNAADILEASIDQLSDGFGRVGITKRGVGKWILANASNSYSGDTRVEQGTLGGRSVGGNLISNATVAPGMSTGNLAVGRNFTQDADGILQIELASLSDFDTVSVQGDAVLDGMIDVTFLGGYAPNVNDTFDILTATNITDLGLTLSGESGFQVSVASGGTLLQLIFLGGGGGLLGDYNENGVVDAADYTLWRDSLGGTNLPNEGASIGVVDEADYEFWKLHFGTIASPSQAVPEPCGLSIVSLALIGLAAYRSRAIVAFRSGGSSVTR